MWYYIQIRCRSAVTSLNWKYFYCPNLLWLWRWRTIKDSEFHNFKSILFSFVFRNNSSNSLVVISCIKCGKMSGIRTGRVSKHRRGHRMKNRPGIPNLACSVSLFTLVHSGDWFLLEDFNLSSAPLILKYIHYMPTSFYFYMDIVLQPEPIHNMIVLRT